MNVGEMPADEVIRHCQDLLPELKQAFSQLSPFDIECLKRFQAFYREIGSLRAFLKTYPSVSRDEIVYMLGFIGLNKQIFQANSEET